MAPYAMSAVTSSIRPAPLPISANGNGNQSENDKRYGEIEEFSKDGVEGHEQPYQRCRQKFPIAIPSIIAMMIRGKSPMCIFFITRF